MNKRLFNVPVKPKHQPKYYFRASGLHMENVGLSEFKLSNDAILFECAATSHTFRGHTNKSWLPNECECPPLDQKAGASSPVKATAVFLMWSLISSELARLQHGGWRSVGKSSVKEKRGSVYLSLLVGHDFSLWSVCRPAPGPPCERQKPWGHCFVHGRSSMRLRQDGPRWKGI